MGKILHCYIFFILEISKIEQMQLNVSLLYDIRWKIEKLLFGVVRNDIRMVLEQNSHGVKFDPW